jgi:hypothetical protein
VACIELTRDEKTRIRLGVAPKLPGNDAQAGSLGTRKTPTSHDILLMFLSRFQ